MDDGCKKEYVPKLEAEKADERLRESLRQDWRERQETDFWEGKGGRPDHWQM